MINVISSKLDKSKLFRILGILLIGGIFSFGIGYFVLSQRYMFDSFLSGYILCVKLILFLILGWYIQIIIHELGHLVFGLFSGYKFVSFRIGSFMLIKQNNKLNLKRYSLAGTGGQCLMEPPQEYSDNLPYVLYNMGGTFFNIIFSVLFLLVGTLLRGHIWTRKFLEIVVFIGFLFAATNGIPFKLGMVNNDGYNTLEIRRNLEAKKCFWIQLMVNAKQSQNISVYDMPKEWFNMPSKKDLENNLCASVGFLCVAREKNLEKRKQVAEYLIENAKGLPNIYKYIALLEIIFVDIINKNIQDVEEKFDKNVMNFASSMKNSPFVIRTMYAYHLIIKKDAKKATKEIERFEKISKNYPYTIEIEEEKELMDKAKSLVCGT